MATKKIKIGTKVKAGREPNEFTGVIDGFLEWTNPFSAFNKKGFDYIVLADDDKKQYKVPSMLVQEL
ncbi:hypothetical protein [Chryseobacterium sp. FH1]|uniref:hypothetical protein n=1 Tax=Chryseobacterium sp. FH1 TaxID=1233951 RepID=UPI0004E3C7DC|nr:hypothetical protein [Chryseobacterium sp. FH1]KFC19343.1 hypothetical protein IO90_08525 [Chryseobacterium sp. FH1]